ncbi:hypothetical protein ILUMI_03896, partial [Ignelater luminosus]
NVEVKSIYEERALKQIINEVTKYKCDILVLWQTKIQNTETTEGGGRRLEKKNTKEDLERDKTKRYIKNYKHCSKNQTSLKSSQRKESVGWVTYKTTTGWDTQNIC